MKLDVLIIAAHPDDAELSMGGTILKLTNSGVKVGVVDITRGEMSTRGNVEMRNNETTKATKKLHLSLRENLDIPDGNIEMSKENLEKIVTLIRKHKPEFLFGPYFNDRHPDHIHTSELMKNAMFKSGISKFETFDDGKLQEAYRPKKMFYYMQTYTFSPSFIIDISEYFEKKMDVIREYKTQFHDPGNNEPETFISSPEFLQYVEARAKFYGFKIGKKYGEAFYCEEDIELNLLSLLKSKSV